MTRRLVLAFALFAGCAAATPAEEPLSRHRVYDAPIAPADLVPQYPAPSLEAVRKLECAESCAAEYAAADLNACNAQCGEYQHAWAPIPPQR